MSTKTIIVYQLKWKKVYVWNFASALNKEVLMFIFYRRNLSQQTVFCFEVQTQCLLVLVRFPRQCHQTASTVILEPYLSTIFVPLFFQNKVLNIDTLKVKLQVREILVFVCVCVCLEGASLCMCVCSYMCIFYVVYLHRNWKPLPTTGGSGTHCHTSYCSVTFQKPSQVLSERQRKKSSLTGI